jgi:hypothetical protein
MFYYIRVSKIVTVGSTIQNLIVMDKRVYWFFFFCKFFGLFFPKCRSWGFPVFIDLVSPTPKPQMTFFLYHLSLFPVFQYPASTICSLYYYIMFLLFPLNYYASSLYRAGWLKPLNCGGIQARELSMKFFVVSQLLPAKYWESNSLGHFHPSSFKFPECDQHLILCDTK